MPCQAYLFRVRGGDFVLEAASAWTLRVHPELGKALGVSMNALYREQPQVLESALEAMRTRAPVTRELPVRRYDRLMTTQVLVLHYVPFGDDQLLVYSHELGGETAAARALEESESRYRSLVEAMPVGVLLRDQQGHIVEANEVAARLLGVASPSELLGATRAPGVEVQHEDGTPFSEQDLDELARNQALSVTVIGVRSARHEGVRWLRRGSVALRDPQGAVRGTIITLVDLTDRIEADRAVKLTAERLEHAMRAARMGSWEYDLATDSGSWSPQAVELFKLKTGARSQHQYREHVHPDDLMASRQAQIALASGTSDVVEHEMRVIGTDGVTRWARVTGRALDIDGRRKLVGTVMDVTRQRQLEDELERSSRLETIGRLAGGVAHDFNNILAAMLGAIELLTPTATPEQQEDLEALRHGTHRASELTRQLLAFARRQPVALAPVGLGALVRQAEDMLRRLLGPAIELKVSVDDWLVVQADQSQLERVLVNLVVNARDAMPQGGRVEISAARVSQQASDGEVPAGDWACLSVRDTGTGMTEETRARLFDPFFTTKAQGTGLGLASSYGMVKQHGGLMVVTTRLGEGSCFKVYLPRRDEAAVKRAADAVKAERRVGLVLVVDDNPLVRRSTERMLESLGYTVRAAEGSRDAVERMKAEPFDAVICDVVLQGESGVEVVRSLRALRPAVRVVLMSGLSEPETGDLRKVVFLRKPFALDGLDAALEAARPGTEA